MPINLSFDILKCSTHFRLITASASGVGEQVFISKNDDSALILDQSDIDLIFGNRQLSKI